MGDRDSRLVYSTGGQPLRQEQKSGAPAGSPGRGVRLRLDRRASDRVVTLVSGLTGTADELTRLLKALKSACGAGGTIKAGVVELQGDHRDKLEAVLKARGIASKRAGG